MRIGLFWRVLPVYLVVILMFCLPLWERNAAALRAEHTADSAQRALDARKGKTLNSAISGVPMRIVLPTLGLDLAVVVGSYSATQTTLTVAKDTANYAPDTVLPNVKAGKTLIYGHWTAQVFGATKNLLPGDIAYVMTGTGHVFKYSYRYNEVIRPTDVQIFNQFKGKPGLVLMTCQGTWGQDRRMMFFNLVSAT